MHPGRASSCSEVVKAGKLLQKFAEMQVSRLAGTSQRAARSSPVHIAGARARQLQPPRSFQPALRTAATAYTHSVPAASAAVAHAFEPRLIYTQRAALPARRGLASAGNVDPADFVADALGKAAVVIFSKSTCPFCVQTKQLFADLQLDDPPLVSLPHLDPLSATPPPPSPALTCSQSPSPSPHIRNNMRQFSR